jgi:uncharacterized small protein (DUF1192 family)
MNQDNSPKQSMTVGNNFQSGASNMSNVSQVGGDSVVTQTSSSQANNADLQSALEALAKFNQQVQETDSLSSLVKRETDLRISMIQAEIQKPKPDKSLVKEVIDALDQGLKGALTLATPVAELAAKIAIAIA